MTKHINLVDIAKHEKLKSVNVIATLHQATATSLLYFALFLFDIKNTKKRYLKLYLRLFRYITRTITPVGGGY